LPNRAHYFPGLGYLSAACRRSRLLFGYWLSVDFRGHCRQHRYHVVHHRRPLQAKCKFVVPPSVTSMSRHMVMTIPREGMATPQHGAEMARLSPLSRLWRNRPVARL
jgi:hypothetical protein